MSRLHKFTFRVPATVYLDVYAATIEDAHELASEWQDHANGWEHFATAEGIADELPDYGDVVGHIDGTAYAHVDVDQPPTLAAEEPGDCYDPEADAYVSDDTAPAGSHFFLPVRW